MGTVYLAHDTESRKVGRLVALKVLPPKRAREENRMLARFQREMDLAQRVGHPHLTKTFDVGDINGVHYIAMEYIRGQSLRRLVADHGPLNVARTARLFSEVADGLQSAHELGLVHRDLKPSNIMVTPNGHAKILDMG
jgi:serine/threonine protein kinase